MPVVLPTRQTSWPCASRCNRGQCVQGRCDGAATTRVATSHYRPVVSSRRQRRCDSHRRWPRVRAMSGASTLRAHSRHSSVRCAALCIVQCPRIESELARGISAFCKRERGSRWTPQASAIDRLRCGFQSRRQETSIRWLPGCRPRRCGVRAPAPAPCANASMSIMKHFDLSCTGFQCGRAHPGAQNLRPISNRLQVWRSRPATCPKRALGASCSLQRTLLYYDDSLI